ncbi:MAG TPA: hypothetical protein VNW54_14655 [Granulicella sp.]|jgi:hypothetical protein|nr:hypothetical protein [Granulicella sp.]
MAKKTSQRSFDDVLTLLGSQRFDVAPAPEGSPAGSPTASSSGAARPARAFRVTKCGCAAEIAEAPANSDSSVLLLARPGVLLNGEISRLLDRGYQKFLKSSHLEIPATADHLRALHSFTEEFNQAVGATSLYNQSLGTTSDSYLYDRVQGRE